MAKHADTPTAAPAGPPMPARMCLMPWFNLHVAIGGQIAPCCEFDGDIGDLGTRTLSEAWHGPEMQELRRKFAADEDVPECWKCFEREVNGGRSFRTEKNRRHPEWSAQLASAGDLAHETPAHPAAYDIRFSNLCNFSCRSCWHGASSRWFGDGKAVGVTLGDQALVRSFDSLEAATAQIEAGLDSIEELHFAGGEPLIIPEHFALLNLLVERGRTDVALFYNTNLSVTSFKGSSIFELWKKFTRLEVHASIDGTGERGALIRRGFDWARFVANLRELRSTCPHAQVRFGITISALNMLSLPQLFEALESECGAKPGDFAMHQVLDPDHYRAQVLPAFLKRKASRNLKAYCTRVMARSPGSAEALQLREAIHEQLEWMHAEDRSRDLPDLQHWLAKLDGLRSEDSLAILPELRPAFEGPRALWTRLQRRLGQ